MRLELERDPQPAVGACKPEHVRAARRPDRREVLEWSSYALLLLVWGLHVLPSRGGWEPYAVTVGTLASLPALLVLRPWRVLRVWLCLLAVLPSVGATVVASATPFGDGGPVTLGRWGYAGAVLLATAAFARTSERRRAVLAVVLLVGLQQFASAWLPWWGGDDGTARSMMGDLSSANPFGGMMLAFALAAAAVVVLGDPVLRRLGWVVAPLAGCAVVLSAARAAMLLLVAGLLVLGVLAVRRDGRAGAWRTVGLAAVMVLVQAASTSRLFFAERGGALSASSAKADSGQTLDSTSGVRLDFWSAAWQQFLTDPLTGQGSGSYRGASRELMTPGAELSPFAHNELLGSLAEGGLALGLPVAMLLGVVLLSVSRLLLGALRTGVVDVPRAAAGVGAGGLLLHAAVDFSLSFPALLVLLALLAALALPPAAAPALGRSTAGLVAGAVLASVAVAGLLLAVSHDRAGVSGQAGPGVVSTSGEVVRPPLVGLTDARVDLAAAKALARAEDPDAAVLRAVEQRLDALARVDVGVLTLQADLQRAAGDAEGGAETARAAAVRAGDDSPVFLTTYARHLAGDGRTDDAFDLLAGEVYQRGSATGRIRQALNTVLVEAERLTGPREPGWSCAVLRLRETGPVPPALAVHPLVLSSLDRCDNWAADAASILGDAR